MKLAGRWIAAVILLQIVSKYSVLDFRKHHSLVSFWEVAVQEAMLYTQETDIHLVDSQMVSHPYSIYFWKPPCSSQDVGHWNEPVKGSHTVIKVVRYLRFVCSKTVKTGEEQQRDLRPADN